MSDIVTEIQAVADHADVEPPAARGERPHRPVDGGWITPAVWLMTTTMLLMVTKGPVFRIRLEAAPVAGDFIDDRWVQGAFVLGAVAVVALCAPAARLLARDPLVIGVAGALVAVIVVSSVWSVNAARTFEQGAMMAVGTAAALLAGVSLGRLHLVTALCTAAHIGVAASLFAFWRDWPLALDRNGDLAGVYFNRNSLGPVALAAAVSAAVLTVIAVQHRRRPLAILLGFVVGADLLVWWRSGSLTPVFGLVVAIAAVGLFGLTLPGPRAELRRRIAVVIGAVTVLGAVLAVVLRGTIASSLGRSPTLSGRTEIWDVVLQFAGERPLHGWGFFAAWTRPELLTSLDEQYGREVYEAHSGYLEVLLGTGLIGLAAMLAAVVVMVMRTATAARLRPDVAGLFLFGVAVYAVAVNLGETYVGANLLPWTLLAITAGWAVREIHRADEPNEGTA